jgi:acyl dehydratase
LPQAKRGCPDRGGASYIKFSRQKRLIEWRADGEETILNAGNIAPYRVRAFNTAAASENKIHDDTVARRFGFAGGLVPGVEVYAYMTHMALERWGRAWLDRGAVECRFLSPVYDGRIAEVTAAADGNTLAIRVESEGAICANGTASLNGLERQLHVQFPKPLPPTARPPADEHSLAEGTLLGIQPFPIFAAYAAEYLHDVGETNPLYADENLAHPGIVLRLCNQALVQNVVLGPWIHVGSTVRNFSAAKVGDTLSVLARVAGNYERKGHRFVDLDIGVYAEDGRPVANIRHVAIYRPRQVAS